MVSSLSEVAETTAALYSADQSPAPQASLSGDTADHAGRCRGTARLYGTSRGEELVEQEDKGEELCRRPRRVAGGLGSPS